MGSRRTDRLSLLAVAGFVCLLTAAAVMLVNQQAAAWTWALAGLGLAGLLGFVVLRPWPRLAAVAGRVGLAVVVWIAGAAAVNLISARVFVRLDLTELRGYSLAPQTLDILAKLTAPVSVTGFLSGSDYRAHLADRLLGEYADRSRWIAYERVDPELEPSAMTSRGVTRYGTLLFESGAKRQEIGSVDEESITGALLRLSSDRETTVYFLSGDGERDVNSAERAGYNVIKWHLENRGYRVATLDLAASHAEMPANGDVLVVASPRSPFPAERQAAVAAFLRGGGKLIVLLDAGLPDPFPAVLADWGVQAYDNLVFDPAANYFGDAATPLVGRFPPSPVTRGLDGLSVFFPAPREVTASKPGPDGIQVTPLVLAGDRSWGEMDLTDPQAAFDPAGDHAGPVSLAVSARGSLGAGRGAAAAGARLVVFGDSDFISNAALSSTDASLGNAALFLNAVKWASEDEALIRLTAINTDVRRVILTGRQMRLVGYASMLFVPLLVVFAGALAWWRQRA